MPRKNEPSISNVKNIRPLLSASWILLLALLLTLPAAAQAQFNYTTNNSSITITSYAASGGEVNIPGTTNGYPVANIGSCAFSNCISLTSVTIPSSVTSIGNTA